MSAFPPLRLLPPLPVDEMPVNEVPFDEVCVDGLGAPPHNLDARARAYFLADGPRHVASGKLLECDLTLYANFCQLRSELDHVEAELVALEHRQLTVRAQRRFHFLAGHKKTLATYLRSHAAALVIDLNSCTT